MAAGSFVSAICGGWISDIVGRKGALWVACFFWMVGAFVQCSSQNVAQLICGRIIAGFGSKCAIISRQGNWSRSSRKAGNGRACLTLSPVGITSSQVCVYLAELAPGRIRGRIVGIQQWAIDWGILIMYLISYGCSRRFQGPAAWRIAWGVQAVPGAILATALLFFPESPRWLAYKGRWDEVIYTLAHLHANGDESSPIVAAELDEGEQ